MYLFILHLVESGIHKVVIVVAIVARRIASINVWLFFFLFQNTRRLCFFDMFFI